MNTSCHIIDSLLFSSLDQLHGLVGEVEKLMSLPVPRSIQDDADRLNVGITQQRIEVHLSTGTWKYSVGYYSQAVGETISLISSQEYTRKQVQEL